MEDFFWYVLIVLMLLPIFADAVLTIKFCIKIAKKSEGIKRIIAAIIPGVFLILRMPLWFDFINYITTSIEKENIEMIKNRPED